MATTVVVVVTIYRKYHKVAHHTLPATKASAYDGNGHEQKKTDKHVHAEPMQPLL